MNIKSIIVVVSAIFFIACGNREDARLAYLDSIDVELETEEISMLVYKKAIDFRPVFPNDTSIVHVVVTSNGSTSFGLNLYPVGTRFGGTLGKKGNGRRLLTYDEQMAMIRKIVKICRERYGAKRFGYLQLYVGYMGDINIELKQKHDSIMQTAKITSRYSPCDAFDSAVMMSQLVSDLKLIFPSDSFYTVDDMGFDPTHVPYKTFANYNKLSREYDIPFVYSRSTVVFWLRERPHFYQVGKKSATVVDAEGSSRFY